MNSGITGTAPERVAAAVDAVARTANARNRQTPAVQFHAVRLQDDLIAPIRSVLVTLGPAAPSFWFSYSPSISPRSC